MEDKNDNSLSKNNAQNKSFPTFFTYQIIDSNNLIKFYCGKCGQLFDKFFYLKRHSLQVELKFKEQCQYLKVILGFL